MELFTRYIRTDSGRLNTIYLEQEAIPNRERVRYRVSPRQEGMRVLVDAYTPEAARSIYEREFHEEVDSVTEA